MTILFTKNLRAKLLYFLHCCHWHNYIILPGCIAICSTISHLWELCSHQLSWMEWVAVTQIEVQLNYFPVTKKKKKRNKKSLLPEVSNSSFHLLVFPPSFSLPTATKIITSMTGTKILLSTSLPLQKHAQQHFVTIDQKYYNDSFQHSLHRDIHLPTSGISVCYESWGVGVKLLGASFYSHY